MVTQAGAAMQAHSSDSNRQIPDDMIDWFLDEVTWFAIYSCILGVVMLVGTYVSIMLFNFAAHSQVSQKIWPIFININMGYVDLDFPNKR